MYPLWSACSSLMVTRTRESNEPARSLFYNILSYRFAGIFCENIFPVEKKKKKERKNEKSRDSNRESRCFISSFVRFFFVVFNFLSLSRSISSTSPLERNSAQGVFKSGNVRLSRCRTFEIEHNGATDTLPLSLPPSLSPFHSASWTTPV